jgi:polyisoprenoid-binding protein YceI
MNNTCTAFVAGIILSLEKSFMNRICIYLLSSLLTVPCIAFGQTKWTPYEYNVSFKIKNAGITVNGKFFGLRTEIVFSPEKLSSSTINAWVDAGTVKTGINLRDKTIKDEHYLSVEKHKLIEASSVKLYTKDNDYAGIFRITIKGTAKEIEIPFRFIPFGDVAEFVADFPLNRRDFNVGGPSMSMHDELMAHVSIKARR